MEVSQLALNLGLFVLTCIVLVKCAGWLVKHLTLLSSYFGLNEFSIGFIIVAVSTSIPELFIGISSALRGNTALALGNVIGSNIADLTLIIGVVVLFTRSMRIRSRIIRKDLVYMIVVLSLPIFLMLWPPTWLGSLRKPACWRRCRSARYTTTMPAIGRRAGWDAGWITRNRVCIARATTSATWIGAPPRALGART